MHFIGLYFSFIRQVFSKEFFPLLSFAIAATVVLVFSGLDWTYLVFTQDMNVRSILFLADGLGYVIPVLVVTGLFFLRLINRTAIYSLYTRLSLYAIILALTLSALLKTFTGRTSPPHIHSPGDTLSLVDNSSHFNFGFMQESILGGWPSSHATVMFALATALYIALPKKWYGALILFGTALFVSIGVTFGWHWMSELVAGASLGVAIGIVTGRHFSSLMSQK